MSGSRTRTTALCAALALAGALAPAMPAHACLAAVRKAAVGGSGAGRPRRGAAAADRAGGAPAGVEAGLGASARPGRRPGLVAPAPPAPAASPPLPLAAPDRLA